MVLLCKLLCTLSSKKSGGVLYSNLKACHLKSVPHSPSQIIPRYGPVRGGISVTIKGSNLGIHKEDIKAISVVGVPCVHQENKYAVSTR